MPCVSTCQRAYVPAWFPCQRTKNVSTSHFFVPTCHKVCQFSTWRLNLSAWHANVPKGVRIFKHSSYEMLREIFILYYYTLSQFYIIPLYLISYLYTSYVYVSYIKIVLYFMSSWRKVVEFLFFYYFFLFCSLVRNENIKDLVSIVYK